MSLNLIPRKIILYAISQSTQRIDFPMNGQGEQVTKMTKKNQSGQTLIEFVLLLAAIAFISFGFMSTVNRTIGERWLDLATRILEDDTQQLQLR